MTLLVRLTRIVQWYLSRWTGGDGGGDGGGGGDGDGGGGDGGGSGDGDVYVCM